MVAGAAGRQEEAAEALGWVAAAGAAGEAADGESVAAADCAVR